MGLSLVRESGGVEVKVSIDAQLIPCAADVLAYAGQKLIVVNGVCIGVQEELPATAPATQITNNWGNQISREVTLKDVLAVLIKFGPATAMTIGDKLGIERPDARTRYQVTRQLRVGMRTGEIHRHPNDAAIRYPRYCLGKGSAGEGAG